MRTDTTHLDRKRRPITLIKATTKKLLHQSHGSSCTQQGSSHGYARILRSLVNCSKRSFLVSWIRSSFAPTVHRSSSSVKASKLSMPTRALLSRVGAPHAELSARRSATTAAMPADAATTAAPRVSFTAQHVPAVARKRAFRLSPPATVRYIAQTASVAKTTQSATNKPARESGLVGYSASSGYRQGRVLGIKNPNFHLAAMPNPSNIN